MAEPIPSAAPDADEKTPTNAEDRKAAKALDALNTQTVSQATEGEESEIADQEALGAAMSRLDIASSTTTIDAAKTQRQDARREREKQKKELLAKKAKIKVSAEDVAFLMEQLDLSKVKATDLLKTHDAKLESATKAFVSSLTSVKG